MSVPEAYFTPLQQRADNEMEYYVRYGCIWRHRPSPFQWFPLTIKDNYQYSQGHGRWHGSVREICGFSLTKGYLVGHYVGGSN